MADEFLGRTSLRLLEVKIRGRDPVGKIKTWDGKGGPAYKLFGMGKKPI